MAKSPGSSARTGGVKISDTCPMDLIQWISWPLLAAMPALSWPRCCRANKPKWVSLAASGFPYIAKTPHSSWNLSNIVLQRLFPAVFEFADIPLDQRLTISPLAYAWVSNDDTILHCRSDLN